MKCDIVFHPATTTMSRCRNMPFVKRWWQDITCSADGACGPARHQTSKQHLDDFGKSGINIINRPSADHENDTPSSSFPCCLATHPQDNTTQMGDTGGDLVEHSALGHVSIITGLEAVMHQNTEHVLRGGLLTDDGGESCRKAAVAFDLLASQCTVMRSNSVLTPLHLPSLPLRFPSILIFLPFYLCLWQPPSFSMVCHSFKTWPQLAREF